LKEETLSDLKHNIKVNPDGRRYITDINMVSLERTDIEDVVRQARSQ